MENLRPLISCNDYDGYYYTYGHRGPSPVATKTDPVRHH